MALPWINGDANNAAISDFSRFYDFCSGRVPNSEQTSAAVIDTVVRTAGTVSKFWVRFPSNTYSSSTPVFLQVNGSDANSTVSVPATTTGTFVDESNTDTLSAGDKINVRADGGGSEAATMPVNGCLFAPASNELHRLSCRTATTSNPADESFIAFTGDGGGFNTTEAQQEHLFRCAGTLKNGHWECTSNSSTQTTNLIVRKNGADTALSVNIPAGTTGDFEDTSNTVAISSGDLACWTVERNGDANTFRIRVGAVDFETTSFTTMLLTSFASGATMGANITRYQPPCGVGRDTQGSEIPQAYTAVAFKASHFHIYVSAARTNNSFAAFRKNGGDGNQVITLTASTTGRFEDATNTDTLAVDDLFNYRVTTSSGGSGSLGLRTMGVLLGPATEPVTPTAGLVTFAELESPLVASPGLVSFAELEAPTAETFGRASFVELETPLVGTPARVSFVDVVAPTVGTDARISFVEAEVPTLQTWPRVSFVEVQSPLAPASGRVTFVEVRAVDPIPPTPSTGRVTWVQFDHSPIEGPTKKLALHVPEMTRGAGGARRGWALHTGQSARALASCLFSEPMNEQGDRSYHLKPYIGLPAPFALIQRCDEGNTDDGEVYAARLRTKPYVFGKLLRKSGVRATALMGEAAVGVDVAVSLIRDYGRETTEPINASLTSPDLEPPTLLRRWGNTDVRKPVPIDNSRLSELYVVQVEVGDPEPREDNWTLDMVALKTRNEEGA